MTDRHSRYIVTLQGDIREADAQAVVTALGMIKGVLSVAPVVANVDFHLASGGSRASDQGAGLRRFERSMADVDRVVDDDQAPAGVATAMTVAFPFYTAMMEEAERCRGLAEGSSEDGPPVREREWYTVLSTTIVQGPAPRLGEERQQ
jgi:hypothetical protein